MEAQPPFDDCCRWRWWDARARVLEPRDVSNPITGTTYRLRPDGVAGWRVTKVCPGEGALRIRHLRGTTAAGVPPPAEAVDRLVRGEHQEDGVQVVADPQLVLAEAVLLDADRVSTVMTALAAEARQRRLVGSPGFRAGCAHLRRQEQEAMAQAADACRAMAQVWRASGLGGTPGLPTPPDWLRAAQADEGT